MPPRMATVLIWRSLPVYFSAAAVTCKASSRVGASTSIFGVAGWKRGALPRDLRWAGTCESKAGGGNSARWCKAGSMKAAVLPEPVCEETIRSRPASMAGMACACTGVGWV